MGNNLTLMIFLSLLQYHKNILIHFQIIITKNNIIKKITLNGYLISNSVYSGVNLFLKYDDSNLKNAF